MVSTRQMATIISPGQHCNEYSVSIAAASSSQSHPNRSPAHHTHHHLLPSSSSSSNDDIIMGGEHVPTKNSINLLDMPVEILEKILSYTNYKKVAQLRLVSARMNSVCSSILNSTFNRLQTQMLSRFQAVKAKMPRRYNFTLIFQYK